MKRESGRAHWSKLIATAVVVAAVLATVSGCPDGSLLGLVGENGEPDTNANLSALTVSQGELYPAFNPATTEYEVSLDSGVPSVVVSGTAAAAGATVSSDSGTSQVLESGANQITITVTAADGSTTKAYLVTVNRGAVGMLDASFDPGAGPNGATTSIVVQDDGRIVIGGWFDSFDGVTRDRVARLNADGSLDTSFAPATIWNLTSVEIHALGVESSGKIVIGGDFQTVDGQPRSNVARLSSDGGLDASFNPGDGADGPVNAITVQSDGRILIGGNFSSVDTTTRNRIARLNSDGSLDTSFDPGDGCDGPINAIAVQSDGRILIGGSFRSVGGTTHTYVARLEATGDLDSTFSPPYFDTGAEIGYADAVSLQGDGRVVVGGAVLWVPGVHHGSLARLGNNGSLDTSLEPVLDNVDAVHAVRLQTDGRVVAGGRFTQVDGRPLANIARFNADGGLDTTFNVESGANDRVFALAVQSDGKIVIGGQFTAVDGISRNRVARLK